MNADQGMKCSRDAEGERSPETRTTFDGCVSPRPSAFIRGSNHPDLCIRRIVNANQTPTHGVRDGVARLNRDSRGLREWSITARQRRDNRTKPCVDRAVPSRTVAPRVRAAATRRSIARAVTPLMSSPTSTQRVPLLHFAVRGEGLRLCRSTRGIHSADRNQPRYRRPHRSRAYR